MIDIAVFHFALEAARGTERHAAVRILFVVDRRLIVDDAYRRAQTIAAKLADAQEGVLKRVADRLRLLAEERTIRSRLRGSRRHAKEPDRVARRRNRRSSLPRLNRSNSGSYSEDTEFRIR